MKSVVNSYVQTNGLGFARLETLRELVGYAPITTAAMQKAAEFWASARREGRLRPPMPLWTRM